MESRREKEHSSSDPHQYFQPDLPPPQVHMTAYPLHSPIKTGPTLPHTLVGAVFVSYSSMNYLLKDMNYSYFLFSDLVCKEQENLH